MTNNQPEGFLAKPTMGNQQAVLVLHPWWGLNDTIKNFCTRLSEAGFLTFAPDLYHGKIATTIPQAENLVKTLNDNQAMADITAAVDYLSEQSGRPVAVIGFSLGAYFAIQLSTSDPQHVNAVVVFYGAGEGDYSKSKASYLGHFAENDQYEDQKYIDEMEKALRAAGRPVMFYQYPGTSHWFFEPDRKDAFNQEAANLAWDRTIAFLENPPIA